MESVPSFLGLARGKPLSMVQPVPISPADPPMATVVATNPPVRNSDSNEVTITTDSMGDKRGEQLHEHSEKLLGDWIMVKRKPCKNSNHTKPKGSYGFKENAIITNNGRKEKSLPTKVSPHPLVENIVTSNRSQTSEKMGNKLMLASEKNKRQ
ncbi:unnamed protein product [Lupinus luteus]|uniref:Uncharacterized protein n=1 Tax=Lupinus luteus TaxID=3873 RepID=A0AAV1W0T1_LUPLU